MDIADDNRVERDRLESLASADAQAAHSAPRRPLLGIALTVLALLFLALVLVHSLF